MNSIYQNRTDRTNRANYATILAPPPSRPGSPASPPSGPSSATGSAGVSFTGRRSGLFGCLRGHCCSWWAFRWLRGLSEEYCHHEAHKEHEVKKSNQPLRVLRRLCGDTACLHSGHSGTDCFPLRPRHPHELDPINNHPPLAVFPKRWFFDIERRFHAAQPGDEAVAMEALERRIE